ncbi:MAG: 1-acyl-sn-glycerol-3-phosphate acyltransferase [Eubacterium sp.]|nr:1-acyl-sn-glycerol-3-phosphate acyltransferase [Eubacterium sp.]
MLRTILSLLVALLYLIITMPVLIYLELFCKQDQEKQIRVARPMIRFVFRVFLKLSGMDLSVKGLEHIPADQPVLFIGNHRSIFDVISTYPLFDRVTVYIAKESLKKIPFFGNWFSYIGSLYFDRNNLKDGIKMLKDAIHLIESGKSVFIFPEGTRNRNETETPLLSFHEGSFRISTKTGCPIIPVAIHNMYTVFGKKGYALTPAPVVIEFGEPIDPASFSKAEQKHLGEHVSGILEDMLRKYS